MLKGNIDVINERVLNSVGKCNYNEYMFDIFYKFSIILFIS